MANLFIDKEFFSINVGYSICIIHYSLPYFATKSFNRFVAVSDWNFLLAITFSNLLPHFRCWKCFDEFFMDKNLLKISLTKFNELNKRGNCNSVYLCFVFSFHFQPSFSLSLADSLICACFRTFFWLEIKEMCCDVYVLSSSK